MRTNCDPRDLTLAVMHRSTCHVKVGAVLADSYGIFAWGHNHIGFNGLGAHAEAEAIRRANRKRLAGATLYIAGIRSRNSKTLTAKPCEECAKLVQRVGKVVYRDKEGQWLRF